MFENIAAIDIGTSSITMVKIRTGFRDFQIRAFLYEEFDQFTENREEEISATLKKMIAEEELEDYRIVTNFPMEQSIIRNITFPFSDVQKIADAIPFEAEENIPFSADNLIMDFQSMKSEVPEEGKVLLGAALKDGVHHFVTALNNSDLFPVKMGLEANALLECYRHTNTIDDETVIQVDIGNSKSIVNLVKHNSLLYTRSVAPSVLKMYEAIATVLKAPPEEGARLFRTLNLDLTSLENNLQRGYYKEEGLKKGEITKIFKGVSAVAEALTEEILLTVKAYDPSFSLEEVSRIMISGGGSNISGIGTLLSRELEAPVVALPFPEEFGDVRLKSQCPIVFGTALSYIKHRGNAINFLKGEFTPDIEGSSRKVFYLGGAFLGLAALVFVIQLIVSFIMISKSNSLYNEELAAKYKRYFQDRSTPENPLAEAGKKLKKAQKELAAIEILMPEDRSVLELIKEILTHFSSDGNFNLKNLVINERVIRIDGSSGTSSSIENFKEKLQQNPKFDSVSLNIKNSRKGNTRFTLTIKKKKTKKKAEGKK